MFCRINLINTYCTMTSNELMISCCYNRSTTCNIHCHNWFISFTYILITDFCNSYFMCFTMNSKNFISNAYICNSFF